MFPNNTLYQNFKLKMYSLKEKVRLTNTIYKKKLVHYF